jgi:hypothetical protein
MKEGFIAKTKVLNFWFLLRRFLVKFKFLDFFFFLYKHIYFQKYMEVDWTAGETPI